MTPSAPLYPLREVVDLAKAQKVTFSKNAEKSYVELGFSKAQAMEVVEWLTANEFRKRFYVEETGMTWDDYLAPRKIPGGIVQTIYVKLRIPSPASVDYVYVTSFHTQRPLADD